jgi:lysophospholipase L1-like esterase
MRYFLCLLLFTSSVFAKDPITIYLAGDSTMAEKKPDKRPETGWGEFLQQHFKTKKVRVENHAMNGRSTRTYVFIEFGHNDQPKEKASHTPPADFRNNLIRFVNETRAKKANPILLTPVMRRRFDDKGEFFDTHFEYPDLMRTVAKELNVPLIDMQRKSERVIKQYGVENSRKLFLQLKPGEHPNYPKGVEDNTHFSPLGAELMAVEAVAGLRELKIDLVKFLKKK